MYIIPRYTNLVKLFHAEKDAGDLAQAGPPAWFAAGACLAPLQLLHFAGLDRPVGRQAEGQGLDAIGVGRQNA